MTEFSKLLSKIIKNNEELKVYHIAKTINCDRTWLQKAMTGERKINYETMLPLCGFLKHYVSDSLVSELYESFAEEYFGSRRYQTILFIRDRLREMEKKEGCIHHLAEKNNFDIEYFADEAGKDAKPLLREIFSLIAKEKEMAAKQNRDGRFYVHIPVKWAAVKDLFLFTLNNEGNGGNIDFRCIFDENGFCENRFDESGYKKEKNRMEAFLSACEYEIYQMKVYDVGSRESSFFQAALLPYYVITGSSVLLISGNGEIFLRINEEKKAGKFEGYFLNMMKEKRFFWREAQLGYEETAELAGAKQRYVFAENFWQGAFGSGEAFEKTTEGYTAQEEAAAAKENVCETEKETKAYVIASPEGLEGEIWNEGGNAERKGRKLRALRRFYEECKRDENKEIYFLNTEKYRFHSRFHMSLETDRMIRLIDETEQKFDIGGGKKEGMYLTAPEIVKYMKDFFLYIAGSGVCMDREMSLRVIERYVERYRKEIGE